MSEWKVIDTGASLPQHNMLIDYDLLDSIDTIGAPVLHLYEWSVPSVTYGYFIDPDDYFSSRGLQKWGLSAARRPTGGGMIFHLTDLAFSIVVPSTYSEFSSNTLDNYRWVNRYVAQAVREVASRFNPTFLGEESSAIAGASSHFCMAKPTIYDVMVDGKKVGGAAQRRTKKGLLHQGSISITFPSEEILRDVLLSSDEIVKNMKVNSFEIVQSGGVEEVKRNRKKLIEAMISHLQE